MKYQERKNLTGQRVLYISFNFILLLISQVIIKSKIIDIAYKYFTIGIYGLICLVMTGYKLRTVKHAHDVRVDAGL